jgi:hypothetical protein
MPRYTPEEQEEIIEMLELRKGRRLSESEIALALDQPRLVINMSTMDGPPGSPHWLKRKC